jgi:hypothetical protein
MCVFVVSQLVTDQRPMLDQLIVINLARHARTLPPPQNTTTTSVGPLVCGW